MFSADSSSVQEETGDGKRKGGQKHRHGRDKVRNDKWVGDERVGFIMAESSTTNFTESSNCKVQI